jgi:DNA uptake protein ComE-like DNA-binding protein
VLLGVPPTRAARATEAGARKTANVPVQDRVDINHASLQQLLAVPGLTRSWAERIVRFRPYHAKNDLVKQGVVSGEVYERIKDAIVAHRDVEQRGGHSDR